jgi:hypothetical protein
MEKATSQNDLYSTIVVSGGVNIPPESSYFFGIGFFLQLRYASLVRR